MRVLLSAGEPSGDRHAAALARALILRDPSAEIEGVGGDGMRAAGAVLLEDLTRLGAMGLLESAGSLIHHVKLLRRLANRIARGRYDLVILVDYPGFHLRVARAAARRGVPVLYYIAPQVWAWGGWRLAALRRAVRRLAVILPFEEPFFRQHGIAAEFVSHPLLEQAPDPDRTSARRTLGIAPDASVLGLFPGSRPGDLARHLALFGDAARRVRRAIPGAQVLVAAGTAQANGVRPVDDPALVRAAADAAIVKSGTATLEAALTGLPMVVAYRMHPVTYRVARSLVQVPHVSLVNLVAEHAAVPELVQGDATAARLAEAVLPLLDQGGEGARAQRTAFQVVRARMGQPGAAARVAAMAAELAA
jgi:lipid-A-disaccharide synthase